MSRRPAEEMSRVMRTRLEKLEALEAKGIEPFAYSFDVTLRAAPSVAAFKEVEAGGSAEAGQAPQGRWAGRLVAFRSHGRSAFADLEDHTGRVQVYLKRNVLGADAYELLDLLDLGDWIGVEGCLFRTRAGQVTVRAEAIELLAKSLRPLPLGKVEVDAETGGRGPGPASPTAKPATASATPTWRSTPASARYSGPGRPSSLQLGASSMTSASWRSRRPCCSPSTAAPRPGPSLPVTTRWTAPCTCASRTNST